MYNIKECLPLSGRFFLSSGVGFYDTTKSSNGDVKMDCGGGLKWREKVGGGGGILQG